ncbi:IclR family transcriptional regulator [Vineibacter terrae]|uniref:IclR family transcriptional regulator n=1 Tax=Vineibacter terrae TaxID=2586908 RepID=A0A5C8PCT1_9HYPH|nr:IclR family transcriptional regulator [Vineibacter terrae]TXL70907.1 IclR family transcriptional regulator [Vineibacter terrae]
MTSSVEGKTAEAELGSAAGTVQSLQRGLQILDMVVQAQEPLRLADIARALEMDRASAFRLLQTLERNGLVAKDPLRKNYTVGGRLLQWASTIGHDVSLVATARPYLEQLVSRTNESGHFGILSQDRALLLDYIGSSGMIVVQNRVGVFEPLYCTALGKALLAFQPEARRERLLADMRFERYTDATLADRAALEKSLDRVRLDGVAYDNGEYNGVLYCVASPVIGRDGDAIGAIGVSMVKPIAIEAPQHIAKVAMDVRAAARAMTAALGGEDVARTIFGTVSPAGKPPAVSARRQARRP